MKKILALTMCLILAACSAIPPELLSVLYTPTAPSPTKVVTPTITPTITPTQPTPTFTFTPTLIGAKPSPTATVMPTIDLSATVTPTSVTDTPGPTMTATATQKYGGFASVFISVDQIYYGACVPNETVITASVQDPQNVTNMVAFFRLVDKVTLKATDWNPSMAMQDKGGGTYTLTLRSTDLLDYTKYSGVWISYQLVGADKKGNPIARTQIVTNSITLMACP
jgi:hypothetical protein